MFGGRHRGHGFLLSRRIVRLVSALCILGGAIGFSPVSAAQDAPTAPAGNAPLTIAIDGNYPPFSILTPAGRPAGLLVEIWKAWSEATKTPITFRASTWDGTLNDLREGRADIHSGLFESPERARWMAFSDAIQEVPSAIFTNPERGPVDSLGALVGLRVGTIAHSFQADLITQDFPEIGLVEFTDDQSLTRALIDGKVDAAVSEIQAVDADLARMGLAGALSRSSAPLFTKYVRAAVLRKNAPLLQRIDAGFRTVPIQHLIDIEKRWLPDPNTRYFQAKVIAPDLTPEDRLWIRDHPIVRAAVTDFIKPIDIVGADGRFTGFNADLMAELSSRLGILIVPEFFHAWSDVVDAAMQGKVDAAFSVSRTPQRSEKLLFTRPYAFDPTIVVVRADDTRIKNWADLSGPKVSVVAGASMIEDVRAAVGPDNLVVVDSERAGLDGLAAGKTEAHVTWLIPYGNEQRGTPIPGLRIAVTQNTENGSLRLAVPKDRAQLARILDRGLAMIPADRLQQLRDRWLAPPDAVRATLGLTSEEVMWLRDHSEISIATMENWPPLAFGGQDGEPTGFDADLVRLLNKRLNGALRIVRGPWPKIYADAKEGRLDAILDITPRPDREAFFDFTPPYLSIPHVIVAPRDAPFLATETDLRGKTLALEKGFANLHYFHDNFPEVTVREYADTAAALDAVARGEADAYAGNRAVAMYILDTELIGNLKIHGRLRKDPTKLAIGTRKNAPQLHSILAKALADISSGERRDLLRRWTAGAPTDTTQTAKLTEAERAWIGAKGKIRVANELDWPPFDFAEDGTPKGYSVDLIREAAKRTGLDLEFVNGHSWAELYKRFLEGGIDLLPAVYRTPERDDAMTFTEGYVANPSVLLTHKDRTEIETLADLKGKRVAIVDGFSTAETLAQRYPDIERVPVRNVLEGLKAVSLDAVDAFIGSLGVVSYISEVNIIPNLRIAGEVWLDAREETVLHMGVLKQNAILRDVVQKGLDAISTEEKRAIRNRWLAFAEIANDKGPRIDLTAEEQAWINEHPVIRVHNEQDWPPFNYNKDGKPAGFSIAYMDLLANKLGIEVKYISGPDWAKFMDMIRAKDLDVMLNIVRTPEREKFILFTNPYVDNPPVIIARATDMGAQDIQDFKGVSVCVPEGFFYQEILARKYPEAKLVLKADQRECLRTVSTGGADATIGSLAIQAHMIRQMFLNNLRVVSPINDPDFANALRIGVRDDWPQLRDLLDKAIDAVSETEVAALRSRWFDESLAADNRITLTGKESAFLAEHSHLTLGIDPAWPPFEFIDEKGHYSGISAGFSSAVAGRLGIQMTPMKNRTWQQVLNGARDGSIDILPMIAKTPERDKFLNFTKPYVSFPAVIVTRSDSPYIGNVSELANSRIGVVESYIVHERLKADYPKFNLQPRDSVATLLKQLSNGELDAVIVNLAAATHTIDRLRITNLKVAAPTEYSYDLAMGVRKGLEPLVPILDKALDSLNDEEKASIKNRWIAVQYEFGLDIATILLWAIPVVGGLAIIIVFIVLWNRRLNREIAERLRTEQRLQFTQFAVDHAAEAVFWVHPENGRFEYVNQTACDSLGYTRDELLALRVPDIDDEFDDERFRALNADLRENQFKTIESRLRARDGRRIDVELTVFQAVKDDRKVLVAGAKDITERKRFQDLLVETEERGRLILESAGEGIFGLDTTGLVTFANPAACRMLGYTTEEMVGHSVHDRIHHSHEDGSDYPPNQCLMRESFTLGRVNTVTDEVLWRKDGTCFPAEYTATPIRKGDDIVGAVVTFRDVTERRQIETELNAKMEELENFHTLAVGRELRMIGLKEEINHLLAQLGREPMYEIAE